MKIIEKFFIKHWAILAVLALLFWALQPLMQPGFFPMHDDEQVGRLFELDNSLKAGHIPPRLAQNLGFGFDYPFFNFYPSFVYYVAEIFVLLGFGYITSIKLMIALGFILAAYFMFLFSRKYVGEIGGLVAATAYTYSPYHAVDVYVRGALPEFWSFVFIPAIFWSLAKLQNTMRGRYVLITSLLAACLVLTHNLVAFMSAPFIGLFALYLVIFTKDKKKFIVYAASSILIGLGVSAYFWIPSYIERDQTMIALLTQELASYSQHFVYIRQLWDSPWGYGGSIYGLLDGLSFEVGKLHIMFVFGSLPLLYYFFKEKRKETQLLTLFMFLFFFAAFMITFYSQFIWDIISQLSYIQFPWRFLLFTSFTSSFITGLFFALKFSERVKVLLACILIFGMVLLYKDSFQPSKYLPMATDRDYTSLDVLRWKTSSMAFEYVPVGIATRKSSIGNTIIDIEESEVANASYTILKGNADVMVMNDIPQEKKLRITAREETLLRLNTFSFPGWKVYLSGRQIEYNDDNKFKLITMEIPKGEYDVVARFTDTIPRTIGNTVSLISLGVMGLLVLFLLRKKLL